MGPLAAGAAVAEAEPQQPAQPLAPPSAEPAVQPSCGGRCRLGEGLRQGGQFHHLVECAPPGGQGGRLAIAPGHQGVTGPGQPLQQGRVPQPRQFAGRGVRIPAGEQQGRVVVHQGPLQARSHVAAAHHGHATGHGLPGHDRARLPGGGDHQGMVMAVDLRRQPALVDMAEHPHAAAFDPGGQGGLQGRTLPAITGDAELDVDAPGLQRLQQRRQIVDPLLGLLQPPHPGQPQAGGRIAARELPGRHRHAVGGVEHPGRIHPAPPVRQPAGQAVGGDHRVDAGAVNGQVAEVVRLQRMQGHHHPSVEPTLAPGPQGRGVEVDQVDAEHELRVEPAEQAGDGADPAFGAAAGVDDRLGPQGRIGPGVGAMAVMVPVGHRHGHLQPPLPQARHQVRQPVLDTAEQVGGRGEHQHPHGVRSRYVTPAPDGFRGGTGRGGRGATGRTWWPSWRM